MNKLKYLFSNISVINVLRLAYLEDRKAPRNTPGRGNRQTALRKGDSMSGFVLKEIETDKIVMVRGEERMVVYVRDKNMPKARDTGTPASAVTKPAQRPQGSQQAPLRTRPPIPPPQTTRTN